VDYWRTWSLDCWCCWPLRNETLEAGSVGGVDCAFHSKGGVDVFHFPLAAPVLIPFLV